MTADRIIVRGETAALDTPATSGPSLRDAGARVVDGMAGFSNWLTANPGEVRALAGAARALGLVA